jgi:hypothetical protein
LILQFDKTIGVSYIKSLEHLLEHLFDIDSENIFYFYFFDDEGVSKIKDIFPDFFRL